MKFTFIVLLMLVAVVFSRSKYPKIKNQPAPKDVLPKLNPDLLPPLDALLEDMQITHRKDLLIKVGVTETRNLLRLKRMDYQMMVRASICL
jgi:hypothetical protein